ncbi:MAG: hypothetical protein RL189_1364 [Pseudomonadota bacterium]|jgi:hypothetical protein
MNQIPDWKQIPSGNPQQRPAAQKRSAGLLFTGILIAISLLAFVLPLAAYHVAQVASVLRVRTSIFLLTVVSFALYALGIVLQATVFAMAGMTGLFSAPLLAIVLVLRSRNKPVWIATGVLALPVVFFVSGLLQIPKGINVREWVKAELNRLPERQGLNKEQMLEQLTSSQFLEALQKFVDLADWQRLALLLFGESGALSVSILGSLLGTVVLIDVAFSQAERIRGVISYVLQKAGEFPKQMVDLLEQTQENLSGLAGGRTLQREAGPVGVGGHEKVPAAAKADSSGFALLLRKIVREPTPSGATDVLGFRFSFTGAKGWNTREFAVPLWASLPALGLLVYVAGFWKADALPADWWPAAPLGEWLVWAALLALGTLIALAVQGALVIHARVRPLPALAVIFVVLLLVSGLQGGALTLVALLAVLGLLDNTYDFRKRLAKTKNAV